MEANDKLKKEILAVFGIEKNGMFLDEIVSKVDGHYNRYTPEQFDQALEELLEKQTLSINEENDIYYLHY